VPRTVHVVVTGSRTFRDRTQVAEALEASREGYDAMVVLVTDAGGAAAVAHEYTEHLGDTSVTCQRFHPGWDDPCTRGCRRGHRRTRADGTTFCPGAGPRCHQWLVDTVARHVYDKSVVCLAFYARPRDDLADDMVLRATAAGIPVVRYGVPR